MPPASAVLAFAYLAAALAAAVVLCALRMPALGVVFETRGSDVVASEHGRTLRRLAPDAAVTIVSSGGAFAGRADELVPDYAPSGAQASVRAWYAQRGLLAAIAARPPVWLTLPGAPPRRLDARPRSLTDLSLDVWLLLGQGAVVGLVGVWLWAARGRSNGGAVFALSCLGVFCAAFAGALFDAREVTAEPRLLRAAEALNEIGSNVCAAGLAALFLHSPRPLLGRAAQAGLFALALLAGLARAFDVVPLSGFYVGLLAFNACILAALAAQWSAARGDPAARALLRWVGAVTFVGVAGLGFAMAAPALLGLPAFGGDGLAFAPLFVVFGGIAFGLGPHRMFDLDRWAYRLMLGVGGALGLLALDAALVALLDLAPPTALALAFLGAGGVYLPARAALSRRLSGGARVSPVQLLEAATEIALTPHADERRARWRELLERLFRPLEIEVARSPPASPERSGDDLLLPALAGETALRLRHRDRGRRLFSSEDLALARELFRLVTWAEAARDTYARGALEERRRIARDLHDDVSATLLTSLHRSDLGEVKGDVRKAMAEIRSAVTALGGEPVEVGPLLADLRFETSERLAAASIALDWPLHASPWNGAKLSPAAARALTASHREIVSNIVRHAGASRVGVRVDLSPHGLEMALHDDGCGLAPGARDGHGLQNVRHRLGRAGGRASFASTADGLRVTLGLGWEPSAEAGSAGAGEGTAASCGDKSPLL